VSNYYIKWVSPEVLLFIKDFRSKTVYIQLAALGVQTDPTVPNKPAFVG